jgi:hypothetical protein
MFTYRLTCPHCGKKHVEHRATPYERNLKKKICVECKQARQRQANGGVLFTEPGTDENADTMCQNCHFWDAPTDEPTNQWYKACAKGRVADISLELDEHQTYIFDRCAQWGPKCK